MTEREPNERDETLKRKITAESLQLLEKQFRGGDEFALLKAIRICANRKLPLPDWAAALSSSDLIVFTARAQDRGTMYLAGLMQRVLT